MTSSEACELKLCFLKVTIYNATFITRRSSGNIMSKKYVYKLQVRVNFKACHCQMIVIIIYYQIIIKFGNAMIILPIDITYTN